MFHFLELPMLKNYVTFLRQLEATLWKNQIKYFYIIQQIALF